MSIPTLCEEDLERLYSKFVCMFQENVLNKGLNIVFDRVWMALHCIDMCVYKNYVYYFSLGLAEYRKIWNDIARELLHLVGVREVSGEPLRSEVIYHDRLMKMHHLINMFLFRYYSENENLCRAHVDSVKVKVRAMSENAKRLLIALALDRELLRYSYICLEEKWLGEVYAEKIRRLTGRDIELKDLEIATVELNKAGLIMYCNIVERDLKNLTTRVTNEYYIAPHLAPIWRQPEGYITM